MLSPSFVIRHICIIITDSSKLFTDGLGCLVWLEFSLCYVVNILFTWELPSSIVCGLKRVLIMLYFIVSNRSFLIKFRYFFFFFLPLYYNVLTDDSSLLFKMNLLYN